MQTRMVLARHFNMEPRACTHGSPGNLPYGLPRLGGQALRHSCVHRFRGPVSRRHRVP